jgi:hypothetical protein
VTETEWLTGTDAGAMWEYVQTRTSNRKRRLFACACLRRAWDRLTHPDSRRAVEAAELLADGRVTHRQKIPLSQRAVMASYQPAGSDLAKAAAHAAAYALDSDMPPYLFAALARTAADDRDRSAQADLLREIVANPFRPVAVRADWRTTVVTGLARCVYAERAYEILPVLADALQDAGCDNEAILAHCRGAGPHARGCWVVDLVLGKS